MQAFRQRTTWQVRRQVLALPRKGSTAFHHSARQYLRQTDDVDPTPGKARGGSEQSTATSGSVDDVADSKGAYDGSTPRPDESGREIEQEKPVSMEQSAAGKSDNNKSSSAASFRQGKARPTDLPPKGGDSE